MNACACENTNSQLASWVRKLEAAITTAAPAGVICVLLSLATRSVFPVHVYLQHYGLTVQQSDWVTGIVMYGFPILWVILDGGSNGATYGMRKRKIRFGDIDGAAISRLMSLLRIIIGVIFLPLFPVSWIMVFVDERRRTIADRVCRTVVWAG